MNHKTFAGGIAAALIALSAPSANALSTFDFQAIADGAGFTKTDGAVVGAGAEGGWSVIVGAGLGIVDNGIGVIGVGLNNAANQASDAYFDAGTAGLGVCSTGTTGTSCAGNPDDNVNGSGAGETLRLDFLDDATDTALGVNITSIFFRDQGHNPFDGVIDVIGGELTVAAGLVTANLGLLQTGSSSYSFIWDGTNTGDKDFYIDSVTVAPIPVPPALLLFGTALGGMGLLARRKKKAA